MKQAATVTVNPQGRLDILLAGIVEQSVKVICARKLPEAWPVLAPHVKSLAVKQIRKLGVPRRRLKPEELEVIRRAFAPRGLPCS